MGKSNRYNRLDKWLAENYDRETQRLEDNLSKDGSFDPGKVDGKALLSRIKEEIEAREKGKGRNRRNKREKVNFYLAGKWAAFLVITFAGLFAASMTSEANREYFSDAVRHVAGRDVIIKIGGTDVEVGAENINLDDEKIAAQKIEDKIGVPVPLFPYKPQSLDGLEYSIKDQKNSIADLEYKYGDTIVSLRVCNTNRTSKTGIEFHGKKINELKICNNIMTVNIYRVKDPDDLKPSFIAQWEYQEGYYQMIGKLEEDEFIEIVKNISY